MDARHRGVQMLGWLSVTAGCGLALLLIRGIFINIMRGFGAGPSQAFFGAILIGSLLGGALAVYLITVGRRALSIAKGSSRPKARFGWGRMLLGVIFLSAPAIYYFHLIRNQELPNEMQGPMMKVSAIFIALGCILIFSGVWRAFRLNRASTSP